MPLLFIWKRSTYFIQSIYFRYWTFSIPLYCRPKTEAVYEFKPSSLNSDCMPFCCSWNKCSITEATWQTHWACHCYLYEKAPPISFSQYILGIEHFWFPYAVVPKPKSIWSLFYNELKIGHCLENKYCIVLLHILFFYADLKVFCQGWGLYVNTILMLEILFLEWKCYKSKKNTE